MAADRAVVSLATKSRGAGLLNLERSLTYAGFGGARLIWRPGEWPAGAPTHEDVPFAFKPFSLEEARRRGHGAALWVDANAVVVGSLDPLFEHIEEHGYVLFANGNYRLGEWASDEALAAVGLDREAALLLPEVNAAALGLRFSHPVAGQFLDDWLAEARRATVFRGTAVEYGAKREFRALKWNVEGRASSDPRVRGHRFDQTAAGIVARRHGMRLTTGGLQSASRLRSVLPETTIVKWRRREPILGLRVDLLLVRMHQAMSRKRLPKHRWSFKFAKLPGKRRRPKRDRPSQPGSSKTRS
jgi:hypothetical protein